MTPEEQAAEDERARQAALAAFATIQPTVDEVTSTRRVDLGDEPMRITPGDYGDGPAVDTDAASFAAPDYQSAAPQREVEGQGDAVPEARDYGAAGQEAALAQLAAEPPAPDATVAPAAAPAVAAETPYEGGAPAEAPSKPAPDPAREAESGPLPRIDDGLPSEDDISGARTGDVLRRIVHALGSGLMVAGGRAAPEFEAQAPAMEQERRQGIREALQRKGVMRAQETQQAATQARQATQDELARRGLDIRQQQADASTAQAAALTPARVAEMEARTERTRLSSEDVRAEAGYRTASREQRADPSSSVSDGMRRAVRARLTEMGPTGARAAEQIGDLDSLNADQLHDILPTLMQGVGIRTGGGGGGGGGASARHEAQIAELMAARRMTREEAERHILAVSPDRVETELSAASRPPSAAAAARQPLAEGEQGPEVFPGLHAGIRLEPGEARAIRHDIGQVTSRMATLGRIQQIARQYGSEAAISPEAAARIRPLLMSLRSMAAGIQGSGVINPSEVPVINASLPDPTDLTQLTFGTMGAALDTWQGMLEDHVAANAGDTGIGIQEGADELLRRMRSARDGAARGDTPGGARPRPASPAAAPSAPQPSGTVRMRRPDGSIAPNVPEASVARARELGWEPL